jgi:hypothetical protein
LNRLSRLHRRLLYATLGSLLVSGALWEWYRDATLMKIHGAAAMLALILFGMLLPGHIPKGWNGGRRKTRIPILGASAWLIVSGYLLYYAGNETVREFTSGSHLGIGLALPLLLGFHVWRRSVV